MKSTKAERCADILFYILRNRGRTLSVGDVLKGLGLEESERQGVQRDLRVLALRPGTPIKAKGEGKDRRYHISRGSSEDHGSLPLLADEDLFAFLLLVRIQSGMLHGGAEKLRVFEDLLDQFLRFAVSVTGGKNRYENLRSRFGELALFAGERITMGPNADLAPTLFKALLERKKLRVKYESGVSEKPAERVLEPWKLVVLNGELYFLCPSPKKRENLAVYKLGRIREAKLLEEQFRVDSDIMKRHEKHLLEGTGFLGNKTAKPKHIKLAFHWELRHILRERIVHGSQKAKVMNADNPDERYVEVSLRAPVDENLMEWIRKWGDAVEVLKPGELKDGLLKYGDFLQETYG